MSTSLGTSGVPRKRGRTGLVLLLLLGGLIGVAAVALARPGQPNDAAADPTPTVTVTTTVTALPPPGTTRLSVDIPDSCLESLKRAGSSAAKVRDLVDAVQGFRVGRARELAEEIRAENPGQLVDLTSDCRSVLDQVAASSTAGPDSPAS